MTTGKIARLKRGRMVDEKRKRKRKREERTPDRGPAAAVS
jgi:hypothetical protein